MASSKRFGIYPATLVHATGSVSLSQLDRVEFRPNVSRAEIIPGGAVDRAHVGIASASPQVMIGTRDLSGFFGGVSGTTGLALATPSSDSTTLFFQERSDAGTFESGTTHEKYVVRTGFIAPQQLTASQDDEQGASLTATIWALWDGTNEPITRASASALSGAPAFSSRFFLGPVYHNGSQIDGIIQTTVDFGIGYVARAFNGDPYPRLGSITTRTPRITFTVAKLDDLASLSMFGRGITSSFAVYYWKGMANATRVAAATTEHVKISCSAGHWGDDTIQVSGNDDGTAEVTVLPTGTLTISTSSALGA